MAKKYSFNLRKICTPAFIYLSLSLFIFIALGLQNLPEDDKKLCAGSFQCEVASKSVLFIINAIYILFWTFILDLLCKNGYSQLSWLIVILPFIMFFIILGAIIFLSPKVKK